MFTQFTLFVQFFKLLLFFRIYLTNSTQDQEGEFRNRNHPNKVLSITRLLSSVLYITCKDFMIGKKLYKNAATILMTLSNENCFCFFRSSIQDKAKFGLLGVCGCRVQNNNFSSSACI